MTQRIAETLILTMTREMSLSAWSHKGLLEREWALYQRLAPMYDRILIISHGDASDQALADRLGAHVTVISNDDRHDVPTYVSTLPDRVDRTVGPIRSAVIKTNQMDDGGAACALAAALRDRGVPVGLIARCGYLRSQFLAREHGPGSPEAVAASLIEQMVVGSADLVVGTTTRMVEDLSWRDGLSPDRVRRIPNFVLVEGDVLHAEARERNLALCVAQLVPRKRVDALIRAVADLPPDEEARLEIIGEGPEEQALRALAAELKAPVTFLGQLPHAEVLQRMRVASVFLHASSLEGHPKTVIEAMACGTPCIVADSPGLGGVIENGVTGIRVSGEAETFAYAIAGLLPDVSWREQLGQCAAARARAEFGIKHVFELEIEAHRAAFHFGSESQARAAPMIRWNPALLQHSPEGVAEAWQEALETLLMWIPDSRKAAVVEAIARRKGREAA